MKTESNPLEADRRFFSSLLSTDVEALERILADDFLMIDVISGSEVSRTAFLELVGSGQLEFEAIEPADGRVRLHGTTAIVTGRTRMAGRFSGTPFSASSRYTHVFVEQEGRWRLAAAQGTPIAPSPNGLAG